MMSDYIRKIILLVIDYLITRAMAVRSGNERGSHPQNQHPCHRQLEYSKIDHFIHNIIIIIDLHEYTGDGDDSWCPQHQHPRHRHLEYSMIDDVIHNIIVILVVTGLLLG